MDYRQGEKKPRRGAVLWASPLLFGGALHFHFDATVLCATS
jgi:hypothetical protein